MPAYPRYEIVGREDQHEYDLMIRDVTIADDAEFQCQVGPADGNPSLIGRAIVTVMGE